MRVVLGVAGGIAAYKACSLLRLLTEAGHDVTVVPTASALRFVGEPTWSALSGAQVHTDVWSDITEVPHVRLGQQADLVVVAPADRRPPRPRGHRPGRRPPHHRAAHRPLPGRPGTRDAHRDVGAPRHPGQRRHAHRARRARSAPGVGTAHGAGTPASAGCPSPRTSSRSADRELTGATPRRGLPPAPSGYSPRVVVTAGGTREPLDPVRFLGNRSSGKQGYALAATAADRGAEVVLVSTGWSWPSPRASRWSPWRRPSRWRTPSVRCRREPTSSSWPPPSRISRLRSTPSTRSRRPTRPRTTAAPRTSVPVVDLGVA